MQIVNNTDETITLEPGEGISVFKTTHRQFEGGTFRIVLETEPRHKKPVSELEGVQEILEKLSGGFGGDE